MGSPARYLLPGANLAQLVTPTADVAGKSGYGVAQVSDGVAKTLYWASTTGPVRIVWDHGTDLPADLVAIFNHNFATGLGVKFQRNSSLSWTAPPVDVALTIEAMRANGRRTNQWETFASTAYRYSSLLIPVNSVDPALGDVWFGMSGQLSAQGGNIDVGHRVEWASSQVRNASPVSEAATVYRRGVTRRRITVALTAAHSDAAAREAILDGYRQLFEATDFGGLPFVFIRDPDVDDAAIVRFPPAFSEIHASAESRARVDAFTLGEVSAGVPVGGVPI